MPARSFPVPPLPTAALVPAVRLPADLSEVVTRVGLAETELDLVDSLGVRFRCLLELMMSTCGAACSGCVCGAGPGDAAACRVAAGG